MLANLCCLKGSLPQGAPTSPVLSNIIASGLDNMIANYIGKEKIRYTRYADDLTFSGNFDEGDLIKSVGRIVTRQKFIVNEKKTRIRKRNQRQEVTGIIVNEKMQLDRRLRHRIRNDVYYIKKFGLKSHLEHVNENKKNYLYHLMGLASYAAFINPGDIKLKEYVDFLRNELKNDKIVNEILPPKDGLKIMSVT